MDKSSGGEVLWQPSAERVTHSRMFEFAARFNLPQNYPELHAWSVANREAFWRAVWEYAGIVGVPGTTILAETTPFKNSNWFPDAQLNFAENLLKYDDDGVAFHGGVEGRAFGTGYRGPGPEARGHIGHGVMSGERVPKRPGTLRAVSGT